MILKIIVVVIDFYLHIVGFFLVKETRVPGKNQRPVSSHWQALSHNIVLGTPYITLHNKTHLTYIQWKHKLCL
jgi:hypothetical protein